MTDLQKKEVFKLSAEEFISHSCPVQTLGMREQVSHRVESEG
jgi:hypothetical protein